MDEYQQRLQGIARKSLREQWLMGRTPVTSSNPEVPKLQSMIPASHTTEQSAEEIQSSERQKKEEVGKSENINKESIQMMDDEPLILSADNIEKPKQAYLGEEERNVLEVLDSEVERISVSEGAQEDAEEKRKAMTEEQDVDQLAVDAVELVDLSQHLLQKIKIPNEPNLSLDNDEEWEIVDSSPEEDMDLVLTSDLPQDQSDSCMDQKGDGAVLKVEQLFVMGEVDLEVSAPEVVNLVVAEKKSDLEDTSCQKPYKGALLTLCFENRAHENTSVPLQELSKVPGTISEEASAFSVQNLPAHTTCARKEIDEDNTKSRDEQSISTSTFLKVEWKVPSGLEDEVHKYIPLDTKREQSPSLLQRKMVVQGIESEIQLLSLPSGISNRAETVTSNKRKTCHCCTVM